MELENREQIKATLEGDLDEDMFTARLRKFSMYEGDLRELMFIQPCRVDLRELMFIQPWRKFSMYEEDLDVNLFNDGRRDDFFERMFTERRHDDFFQRMFTERRRVDFFQRMFTERRRHDFFQRMFTEHRYLMMRSLFPFWFEEPVEMQLKAEDQKADPQKAAGPDNIPGRVIRGCGVETKQKEMVFDFRRAQSDRPPLNIDGSSVEIVKSTKLLDVHLTENLTWSLNTSSIAKKAQQRLYFLRNQVRWSKTDGFKITANPDPWQNAQKKAFQQPGKDPSDGGHGFPECARRWFPDLHDGVELLGICALAA